MLAAAPPLLWPERRYPWGTAEAFNPEHSDLLALRALLLREALEDIVRDKRARYEAWRRAALAAPRLGRRLRGFLLWTVAPVAAALWFAQNGFDVERSRRQLRAAARRLRLVGDGEGGGSSGSGGKAAAGGGSSSAGGGKQKQQKQQGKQQDKAPAAPAPPAKKGWW